jgi:hypothetical protein
VLVLPTIGTCPASFAKTLASDLFSEKRSLLILVLLNTPETARLKKVIALLSLVFMSYLIAVLCDRLKAEEAYTALEKANIPTSQITIVGKGYRTADELGLIDPARQAKKRAMLMAYWLVPFGFVAGYTFNLITGLDTFDWAGEPGNHILGGVLGAIGGAMGSIFVGGGVGLTSGSGDALPYRNFLDTGKYLIVVEGSDTLKQKATQILRQFEPDNIQNYSNSEF